MAHGLSVARSCRCVGLSRATYYETPVDWSARDAEVIDALNQLVETNPRWGFWKYFDRLRALGRQWNHKRVYRVYCALGLNQPRRTKRRLPERERIALLVPERANQVWSADFMSDALYQGPRFRTFNVIDDYNREVLAIEIDTSLRADRIRRVLDRIEAERGLPDVLRVDNGPEFLSQVLADWAKGEARADLAHPARQAEPECLHRTLQPDLSQRSAGPVSLQESGRGAGDNESLARRIQ